MSEETRRVESDRLHEEGMALDDAGDSDGALHKYFAALELEMGRSIGTGIIMVVSGERWLGSTMYNRCSRSGSPRCSRSGSPGALSGLLGGCFL